jgi:signal peptidase II
MIWVLGTATAVFILDILTKQLALEALRVYHPVCIVPGFFNLSLVFNRGAAFGIFPGGAAIFTSLAAATIVVLLIIAYKNRQMPISAYLALGLICGGAAGNLLDRLRYGYVVDFLDVYLGQWHWPAFNIADSSLCVGASLFLLQAFRKGSVS